MLTSVLRDSLGGNCTTTMIATLAADHKSLHVRMSTYVMLAVIQWVLTRASLSVCAGVYLHLPLCSACGPHQQRGHPK